MRMGERRIAARKLPRFRGARQLLAGSSAALMALLGAGRDGVGGNAIITEYRFPKGQQRASPHTGSARTALSGSPKDPEDWEMRTPTATETDFDERGPRPETAHRQ